MLDKLELPYRLQNKQDFVIGHRGCVNVPYNKDFQTIPEMSDEALDYAYYKKHNAIEVDVWLSKDNKIVVHHDVSLKRMFGVDKKIYDLTLNQLESYKFINNKGRDMTESLFLDHILTLEYVIEFILAKDMYLFIEIKDNINTIKLCDEVLKMLKKYNIWNKIVVISFIPRALYRIKKKSNNKLHIGLLFEPKYYKNIVESKELESSRMLKYTYWIIDPISLFFRKYIWSKILGSSIVGAPYDYIFNINQKKYIKYCKKRDMKLFVWGDTVDRYNCFEEDIWCEADC